MVRREWRARQSSGPRGACHADTLELCVAEEGSEIAEVEGEISCLTAGRYGLIPPNFVHSSWTEKQPSTQTIVHLPVRLLKSAVDELGAPLELEQLPLQSMATPLELSALVSALKQYGKQDESELLVSSLLAHLSLWLMKQHLGGRLRPVDADRRIEARLREVEALMRDDLSAAHQLDELAAAAGLSTFHFLRRFRRLFGRTPHAHLLNLRVKEAARLLRSTEMSATAIAFEVGFNSASGLGGAIRKAYGQTPAQFRAR